MLCSVEQFFFLAAKKRIASQANRTLFCLLKKAKALLLPIDIQIEVFQKTVKPIFLYACEICGYGNVDTLEQTHLYFLIPYQTSRNLHLIVLYMVKFAFCP